ncbi:hypothetical protein A2U01_0097557, partial [Trifolium medium]|nr:hypothetical protein [Trifolium medium]
CLASDESVGLLSLFISIFGWRCNWCCCQLFA